MVLATWPRMSAIFGGEQQLLCVYMMCFLHFGIYFASCNAFTLSPTAYQRKLPVPVIGSLHGMCYGGGLQIALGADMRFSTPDCRLSIMESRWGLIPDSKYDTMIALCSLLIDLHWQ